MSLTSIAQKSVTQTFFVQIARRTPQPGLFTLDILSGKYITFLWKGQGLSGKIVKVRLCFRIKEVKNYAGNQMP